MLLCWYLQFLLFTLTFSCWDCSHKGWINIQNAHAWSAPASVMKCSFYYFSRCIQTISIDELWKKLLHVRGRWLNKGREWRSHDGINVITYSPKWKKPAVTRGHPDINREDEMSSFNTSCTDSKCFIPLTCLYVCFVLCSLTRRGGKKKRHSQNTHCK